MSKPVQVLVALAAVVVIIVGGLWLLSAAHEANSPEAKCRQVMADVERERAPATIDPGIWQSTYDDCVARER